MKSQATGKFWKICRSLPPEVKQQAREVFRRFQEAPYGSGLRFKRVHSTQPIFSVRISQQYRALGVMRENQIIWFWIGSHADYDSVINILRRKKGG